LLGTKDYVVVVVVVVVVVGGCYTGEDAEQWDDERDC
jgi:hypothetical protein